MRSFATVAALAALAAAAPQSSGETGELGDAPKEISPVGAEYVATLPNSETTLIRGTIRAVTSPSGEGVIFDIALNGFPVEEGPFSYHIHELPVTTDCNSTKAHQDPYKRGELTSCDASAPQTCQTGDLSGKHGKIEKDSYVTSYVDEYVSLDPNSKAFFGDLSVVIHVAKTKQRLTCANFKKLNAGAPNYSSAASPPSGGSLTTGYYPSGTGSPNGGNATSGPYASSTPAGSPSSDSTGTATPPAPSAPQSTGGAVGLFVSTGAVLAAIAAFAF